MILGAYAFEPKELKSRENLLFWHLPIQPYGIHSFQ